MKFRWGFKTEAHSIARAIRADMGLRPSDPIDPFQIAAFLGIPTVPISELRDNADQAVRQLQAIDRSSFSALTVFDGSFRMIFYNDANAPVRQNSDIAHELAHSLLFHSPDAPISSESGRDWDDVQESEADWLCGAILVSDEAAFEIVSAGLTQEQATQQYGVSRSLLELRIRFTGARKRVQRAAGHRG
jgi:Zn-dependent peptidase ImmA (M78 family)